MVKVKYTTPNQPYFVQLKTFETREEADKWISEHAVSVIEIVSDGVATLKRLFG